MTTPTPDHPSGRRPLVTWRRLLLAAFWLVTLVVASRATLFLVEKRTPILRRLGMLETTGVITSNLYAVGFQRIPIAIDGRYGAIAPLAGGVLFSSRSGRLWYVDSTRTPRALALHVPIDVAGFEEDPANATTTERDHFAVKGLLTQVTPTGVRILASHNYWDAERDCYGLRVSMAELPLPSLLAGGTGAWTTLFDSRPCLQLSPPGIGRRIPTIGAGGRMVTFSPNEVLLTVGVFVSDAQTTGDPRWMRQPGNDYGKTLVIDLKKRTARPFTIGHRNPQGLARGADGRLWLTEHAERGGDELNLLREGRDYGFPYVSYGTEYGSMEWPLSGAPGRHAGYEPAAFSWVPSIGTSQLLVVEGTAFTRWKGDLIVSSLAARSFFRVRLENGHVVYVEPFPTIHRIRDIIETARGEIVFLAEDGFLVYLVPLDVEAEDPNLMRRERGQIVAGRCQGCHTFEKGGRSALGPNLHGVIGRRVGSLSDFTYSRALRDAGGRWSEERIRQFLSDPATYLPGTSMELPAKLTEREVANLIIYLKSLN